MFHQRISILRCIFPNHLNSIQNFWIESHQVYNQLLVLYLDIFLLQLVLFTTHPGKSYTFKSRSSFEVLKDLVKYESCFDISLIHKNW